MGTERVAGAGTPVYAGISGITVTAQLDMATQNTWYQVASFDTNGASSGPTPDNTENHIIVNTAGTYNVGFSASFSGSASATFELEAKTNNGATSLSATRISRKLGTGGDIGDTAKPCYPMALSAADTVELWGRCTSAASKNIIPSDITLSIVRLGD